MTKLIAYIEYHGQVAIEQDGELMVLSHFGSDEKSFFEWERCEATFRAVRDWLGY